MPNKLLLFFLFFLLNTSIALANVNVGPYCNNIIISANNNSYKEFGYSVVKDIYKECGPISGILEGLKQAKYNKVIVLSCDSPFVEVSLIKYLLFSNKSFTN